MRTLIILLFFSTTAFANTVYYDPVTKKKVTDVSDKKTLAEVRSEFGLSAQTQVIPLADNESARVVGNSIQKYDHVQEAQDAKNARDNARQAKKSAIKAKLGLNDQDWENLIEAIRE